MLDTLNPLVNGTRIEIIAVMFYYLTSRNWSTQSQKFLNSVNKATFNIISKYL